MANPGQLRLQQLCSFAAKVFVQWSMTGTSEGERAETSGISLMSFDDSGKIAETRVYRQALPGETAMAQKPKRVEPVKE